MSRGAHVHGTTSPKAWARGSAFGAILAASVVVVPARGADDKPDAKQACIAAAERGQGQRDDGKYRAARDAFVECAQDTCPRVIQQSCTKWLRELEESTPTVVLGAKDEHGTDLTDVTVTLDDTPFATLLDGKPVPIDTGPHVLRFQRGSGPPVEQKLVVRAGERARVVSVTLSSENAGESTQESTPQSTPEQTEKPSPPPEPLLSPRHVTTAAITLGALAVAGTGLAFVLQSNSHATTASGLRTQIGSQSACGASSAPPQCPLLNDAVNSQHSDMNVATGLFVGAGALLAGAVTAWFVWPKPQASEPQPAEPPPAEPQTTGSIVPIRGGAAFFFSRSF
jgi:hypothetical protein